MKDFLVFLLCFSVGIGIGVLARQMLIRLRTPHRLSRPQLPPLMVPRKRKDLN